jgi:2-oxo-4-hydroxy-4-carboxy-5-ureidoimidazoline decarboxylase
MALWRRLDAATAADASRLLTECCGATRWVERMVRRRPFGRQDALLVAAEDEWRALGPDDWREAFAHHPKIGDRAPLGASFAATRALSDGEQTGVMSASEAVLDALAEGNRRYEERFGYIFIVCATGKSADEMLSLLRARLDHDPATEIRIAAAEQERITAIRLRRD